MLKIKRIIIHEDFNINNLENDIALIEVTDMKDQVLYRNEHLLALLIGHERDLKARRKLLRE